MRKQLNVRMTEADSAILARLRERTGLDPTGIIRLALRELDARGIAERRKTVNSQYWRHSTSGETYAVLLADNGAVTGACGPLAQDEITAANLDDRGFHYYDDPELVADISEQAEDYRLVEPPYIGDERAAEAVTMFAAHNPRNSYPHASLSWEGPGWYAGQCSGESCSIRCLSQRDECPDTRSSGYGTACWSDTPQHALGSYAPFVVS